MCNMAKYVFPGSQKWTNQKSNLTIHIACQKEAYPENFINLGWPQAKWIHHLPTWPQGVDDILDTKISFWD